MKRIALLTSGGDCPGLNPCIRSVVRTAVSQGVEVVGVRRGWRGLLENDTVSLGLRDVAGIVHRGGTILHSSRCPEFHEAETRANAAETLAQLGVGGLVVLGGNGTLRGAGALSRQMHLPVVGVPQTIDNDVGGSDYALGFDTAINTAVEAIDKIRDTATSHERLFFVEVMGRDRGILALHVAIACGAEGVLIPETATNYQDLLESLERARDAGKASSIVVVAEGDDAGNAYEIAREIEKRSDYEPRVSVLGYIQRGGSPSAQDRIAGGRFGKLAVDTLLAGEENRLVALRGGIVETIDLERAWSETPRIDEEMHALTKVLSS